MTQPEVQTLAAFEQRPLPTPRTNTWPVNPQDGSRHFPQTRSVQRPRLPSSVSKSCCVNKGDVCHQQLHNSSHQRRHTVSESASLTKLVSQVTDFEAVSGDSVYSHISESKRITDTTCNQSGTHHSAKQTVALDSTLQEKLQIGPYHPASDGRKMGMYPRLKKLRPLSLAPASCSMNTTSCPSLHCRSHSTSAHTSVVTQTIPSIALIGPSPASSQQASPVDSSERHAQSYLELLAARHPYEIGSHKLIVSSSTTQNTNAKEQISSLEGEADREYSSSLTSTDSFQSSTAMAPTDTNTTHYSTISALDLTLPPDLHKGPLDSNPMPSACQAHIDRTSTPPPIVRVRRSNPLLQMSRDSSSPDSVDQDRTCNSGQRSTFRRCHSNIMEIENHGTERNKLRKSPPPRPATSLSSTPSSNNVRFVDPVRDSSVLDRKSGDTIEGARDRMQGRGLRYSLSRVFSRSKISKPVESFENNEPLKRVSLHRRLASSNTSLQSEDDKSSSSRVDQTEGPSGTCNTVPYQPGLREWNEDADKEMDEFTTIEENLKALGHSERTKTKRFTARVPSVYASRTLKRRNSEGSFAKFKQFFTRKRH